MHEWNDFPLINIFHFFFSLWSSRTECGMLMELLVWQWELKRKTIGDWITGMMLWRVEWDICLKVRYLCQCLNWRINQDIHYWKAYYCLTLDWYVCSFKPKQLQLFAKCASHFKHCIECKVNEPQQQTGPCQIWFRNMYWESSLRGWPLHLSWFFPSFLRWHFLDVAFPLGYISHLIIISKRAQPMAGALDARQAYPCNW